MHPQRPERPQGWFTTSRRDRLLYQIVGARLCVQWRSAACREPHGNSKNKPQHSSKSSEPVTILSQVIINASRFP
jgi:hypothetical protein